MQIKSKNIFESNCLIQFFLSFKASTLQHFQHFEAQTRVTKISACGKVQTDCVVCYDMTCGRTVMCVCVCVCEISETILMLVSLTSQLMGGDGG